MALTNQLLKLFRKETPTLQSVSKRFSRDLAGVFRKFQETLGGCRGVSEGLKGALVAFQGLSQQNFRKLRTLVGDLPGGFQGKVTKAIQVVSESSNGVSRCTKAFRGISE